MWDGLWIDEEFYKKIDKLVLGGKFRLGLNKKLVLALSGGAYDIPWVVIKQPDLKCFLYGQYFDTWDLIHSHCAKDCWKVCVYPRTVKELFDLYDIMVEMDLPSKCGVDIRDYTPEKETNYAGYFYCDSKQQADSVYEYLLRYELPYNVIIKSGCTEHEISDTAKVDLELEKRLDSIFDADSIPTYEQGDWLKNRIKVWWLKHARSTGDKSYKEISLLPADGKEYKTYQKED